MKIQSSRKKCENQYVKKIKPTIIVISVNKSTSYFYRI